MKKERKTMNFSIQKPLQLKLKTFFCLYVISDTKTALILANFPEKARTLQNFCAQRPQTTRWEFASKPSERLTQS